MTLAEGRRAPDFSPQDQDGRVVRLSDLRGRTVVLYLGVERSTFVIGPDGVIQHVFRGVKPAEHDERVLGAVATG
jgi:peroxiredoxin